MTEELWKDGCKSEPAMRDQAGESAILDQPGFDLKLMITCNYAQIFIHLFYYHPNKTTHGSML